MAILQYDAKDAVLGGMRRDYNLADFPVQPNDFSLSNMVQPVVNIKDAVTIRCSLGMEVPIPINKTSTTILLKDPRTNKAYQGWNIKFKRGTSYNVTGTTTMYALGIKGYRDRILFKNMGLFYSIANVGFNTLDIDMMYDTVNCIQNLIPTIDNNTICIELQHDTYGLPRTVYLTLDVEMTPGKPQMIPMQESA